MNKQIISLQLPEDVCRRIKSDAEKEFISTSAFIRKILMQYYKEKDKCTDTSIK